MDSRIGRDCGDPIIVSSAGAYVRSPRPWGKAVPPEEPIDALPWLKARKMRKFMGKQDLLAVIAAGMAAQDAKLGPETLRERTGLYLSVGHIPFEHSDIEPLTRSSTEGGRFSMERFSTEGFEQTNPLLTFRCLPNMPIFHVSMNLGIQGPYFITYPGPGQFYLALERALSALRAGEIDAALVGGVADQDNFLVSHHFRRLPQSRGWLCADASGFLCLERLSSALAREVRPRWECLSFELGYAPHDPLAQGRPYQETLTLDATEIPVDGAGYLGPASLPVHLAWTTPSAERELYHQLSALDGIQARSRWKMPAKVPALSRLPEARP